MERTVRLGNKHYHAVLRCLATCPCLPHETRWRRIVHEIKHYFARREPGYVDSPPVDVWEHSDRRRVHDDSCVLRRLLTTPHERNLLATVLQHRLCRMRGAAGAKNRRTSRHGLSRCRADGVEQLRESEMIGVVAAKPAVGKTRNEIDVA